MDKNIFEKEEKNFFKGIGGSTEYKRAVPEIDKFVKFWKGIWEKGDRTPNTIWMEKIREELNKKITSVKQLDIIENGLISEIKKRKSCKHQVWMEFRTFCGKGLNQYKKHYRKHLNKLEMMKD